MDEKKPESAWDELVEKLGVEADPTAAERHQPRPTALPSASRDRPVSAPTSRPSDWNALAGSLGLEPSPPPASTLKPSTSAKERKPEQEKPLVKKPISRELELEDVEVVQDSDSDSVDILPELRSEFDKELVEATADSELEDAEDSSTGISGEAARDAFDSLFAGVTSDWELPSNADNILDTPLEFSHSLEEPLMEAPDFESEKVEKEETTERPKRRRSRRRRGRGGRSSEAKPDEATTEAEDAEAAEDATGAPSQQGSADAEVAKDKKPRRSRPRRRGRRSEVENGEKATVGEAPVEEDSPDLQQAGELGLYDDDDDEDDVEDGSDGEQSSRQRASHRNLPTWSEAIGGIVDANLEIRSKSPSRATSSRGRSRGGKGRRKE